MTITLDIFKATVDGLIAADEDELSTLRRYRQIRSALEQYSSDRPDQYAEDVTGNAGRYYILTGANSVLANWIDGFSRIISIQYPAPVIASNETPIYLDPEDWQDNYESAGITYLYFPSHAPAATEKIRILHTLPYIWAKSTTSITVQQTAHGFADDTQVYQDDRIWYAASDDRIATHVVDNAADDSFDACILAVDPPTADFYAICELIASKYCLSIAARYSRTSDSTIRADSVDHISRGREFSDRSKEFMRRYREHMGLDKGYEKDHGIFGKFVNWDTDPSLRRSKRYLFHRDR